MLLEIELVLKDTVTEEDAERQAKWSWRTVVVVKRAQDQKNSIGESTYSILLQTCVLLAILFAGSCTTAARGNAADFSLSLAGFFSTLRLSSLPSSKRERHPEV
jgi:hypothetical protein